MPPIPVYSSSPISAAKAAGATPQTADPELTPGRPAPATTTATTTASPGNVQAYPAAQPGARPSLPVPTGAPAASNILQPTPTQSIETTGPPAPQPGAVPLAPGATKHLPPPPKAGESLQAQDSQTSAPPMPAQMSYPPPQPSFASYSGSSTTTVPFSAQNPFGARPVQLGDASGDLSHPPGYQQDINAAEFSSHQRAAHNASLVENSGSVPSYVEGTEKAWDAAKKWAAAAGESLAAAENESRSRLGTLESADPAAAELAIPRWWIAALDPCEEDQIISTRL
ncbi:hypothetical protein HJFPF1_02742 [Paramyrothecium foliicola]|nr:hypothetical protein HJFPF1_02742 [Paramyrothecium foliicola]